jgi:hypothetical protein
VYHIYHPPTPFSSTYHRPQAVWLRGQTIPCWVERLVHLLFQDQDFSCKFLLANVAFPSCEWIFLRFHKLLLDPCGNALLDSTGRRFTSLAQPCPPTATSGDQFCTAILPSFGEALFNSKCSPSGTVTFFILYKEIKRQL